jgi:hypothetical protein
VFAATARLESDDYSVKFGIAALDDFGDWLIRDAA